MMAKLLAALFFLLIAPCVTQANEDLQSVSLQLKWKHAFQFAGFYMAKEKGFYRKAGLDVEIRETSADTNLVDEVLSGRATFGVSDSALVQNWLNGEPVIALAAIFQHSPLALMTLKSSGITTPDLLKGKKVMMFYNRNTASLTSMLASKGVNMNDFIRVPHSFNINDLIEGRVDAYEVYTSDQPQQLELLGIQYNLLYPGDYGFDFYGDILFTSLQELRRQPGRTKAFYEATINGWEYAFEHIDETVAIILKNYNSQHLTKEHLYYEARMLKKSSGLSEGLLGHLDATKIDSIANIYRLLGLVTEKAKPDNFIYKEGDIYLSLEEKKYIAENEINIISTDNWPPFNARDDDGNLYGIAIDYWSLIQQKTGLKSHIQGTSLWRDVINGIKNKTADLTISTSATEDRKQYAIFSDPYAFFPVAIATTTDKGFISSGADLVGKTVAVGNDFSAHKILKQYFPDIKFVPVEDTITALQYVSDGKAFAAVDVLPVLTYKIGELGYGNLKISGTTGFNIDIRVMARKDLPQLISIINKGINAITEDEKKSIINKWVAVKIETRQDYSLVWKISLPLFFVLAIILFWNRVLKREIKRREDAENKLRILATTDVLTSVPNRYKMENELDKMLRLFARYNRSFTIIFLDLDDFKIINDSFGHEAGDVTLVEFAALVKSCLRKSDYFGRWGGEEFLVILPEATLQDAIKLANKLLKLISSHKFSQINQLTSSIGIAEVVENDTLKSLLSRADMRLYRAKELGKNRIESLYTGENISQPV
jgi:polar amino acid transport system substrate-binding protein